TAPRREQQPEPGRPEQRHGRDDGRGKEHGPRAGEKDGHEALRSRMIRSSSPRPIGTVISPASAMTSFMRMQNPSAAVITFGSRSSTSARSANNSRLDASRRASAGLMF